MFLPRGTFLNCLPLFWLFWFYSAFCFCFVFFSLFERLREILLSGSLMTSRKLICFRTHTPTFTLPPPNIVVLYTQPLRCPEWCSLLWAAIPKDRPFCSVPLGELITSWLPTTILLIERVGHHSFLSLVCISLNVAGNKNQENTTQPSEQENNHKTNESKKWLFQ